MNMLVAPPPSVDIDACSAAMSVKRISAAAECNTGTDTLTSTLDMIWASRSVHVPEPTSGNRNPLKNAAGLYIAFFKAL